MHCDNICCLSSFIDFDHCIFGNSCVSHRIPDLAKDYFSFLLLLYSFELLDSFVILLLLLLFYQFHLKSGLALKLQPIIQTHLLLLIRQEFKMVDCGILQQGYIQDI